jgi:hypothetical protein
MGEKLLRFDRASIFILILLAGTATHLQAQRSERQIRRDEERKMESLREVSARLNRLSSRPNLVQENRFLHEQASALAERSRQAPAGSYLLARLESAIDGLLDASEHILESSDTPRDRLENSGEENRRTARELERTYFRITQGDYFAAQSRENNAREYVLTARRLYQQARAAYDASDYRHARRLAEAGQEIISALESLAQAAVAAPEPPRLPEE